MLEHRVDGNLEGRTPQGASECSDLSVRSEEDLPNWNLEHQGDVQRQQVSIQAVKQINQAYRLLPKVPLIVKTTKISSQRQWYGKREASFKARNEENISDSNKIQSLTARAICGQKRVGAIQTPQNPQRPSTPTISTYWYFHQHVRDDANCKNYILSNRKEFPERC